MRSCFFAALVLVVLMPASAQGAVNQWTVTPGAPGPGGTVSVTADVTVDTGGSACMSSGCGYMGPPRAYLTVTPCPEGVTCTGGSYSGTYDYPWTATFVLRCGVEYTFAGWWDMYVMQWSPIPEPPYMVCMWPMLCGGSFQPTTFIDAATPAAVTSWGRLKVMYR